MQPDKRKASTASGPQRLQATWATPRFGLSGRRSRKRPLQHEVCPVMPLCPKAHRMAPNRSGWGLGTSRVDNPRDEPEDSQAGDQAGEQEGQGERGIGIELVQSPHLHAMLKAGDDEREHANTDHDHAKCSGPEEALGGTAWPAWGPTRVQRTRSCLADKPGAMTSSGSAAPVGSKQPTGATLRP